MIITRSDFQENLLIVGEKYNKLRAVSFLALNINTSIMENHDALYESHSYSMSTFCVVATTVEHTEEIAIFCWSHANTLICKSNRKTLLYSNGNI